MIVDREFGAALSQYLRDAFTPVLKRVRTLEARLDTVEKSLTERSYRGVYEPGARYKEHNWVTKGGSLWVALCDTDTEPGVGDSAHWKLAVKRGRDGRDAR